MGSSAFTSTGMATIVPDTYSIARPGGFPQVHCRGDPQRWSKPSASTRTAILAFRDERSPSIQP